jgi:transcription antitermination factor NusG
VPATYRNNSFHGRGRCAPRSSVSADVSKADRAAAHPPVDLFPPNLLSSHESLSLPATGSDRSGWWLAHTRPRQEKAAAADFFAWSVPFYLPLLARTSVSRGRPRLAREPLFPGYVFVFGSEEDRLTALKTNRLLTVQYVPDGEQLREELSQFAELIAAGARLTRESRLVAGERVRIKAGPFRDIEGVILRRNGKTELLVAIDFLRQGASLEVDECMLEPI